MDYWSFKTLHHPRNKFAGSGERRLYLSRYVALEPETREAEEFLGHLEEEGYLPPTVLWISGQGHKIRLFQAPDGAYPLVVNCNGMGLKLRTGGSDSIPVKSRQFRRGSFELFGDPGFLIMNPALLPQVTFEFLRLLALIPPGAINLHPATAQGKSGA